ncbi:MAG: pantoate--beta-alanine ligase [Candidatus Gastranaerophilales bacterium]|nr:pantoate--beta-alanine ligase [Candidatus Gastranaerophilales bacterium]
MITILTNNIQELKNYILEWKKQGLKIGLVPTMGALHAGHQSLIKKAVEMCDKVIVSVFVNPIQFGPKEDYDKYPRTIDSDLALCEKNGAAVVFAPTPAEMYGIDLTESKTMSTNVQTFVCPPYDLVDKLCGRSRPVHFDGVATVVLKLFNISQADCAFFGQKDAQQLIILKRMVKDLNIPIEIVPCPIVREDDGMALSSRNKYLSPEARKKAVSISKSLTYIKSLFEKGTTDTKILFDSAISVLDKTIELEYLEFVDTKYLEPQDIIQKETLVAIAAKIDNVRLIDNILLG